MIQTNAVRPGQAPRFSGPQSPSSQIAGFPKEAADLIATYQLVRDPARALALAQQGAQKSDDDPIQIQVPNVPRIPLDQKVEIARLLQPGDVIIHIASRHPNVIDRGIIAANNRISFAGDYQRIPLPEPWRATHCLIAVGNGKVAEANIDFGTEVRLVDVATTNIIHDIPDHQYLVFRPKNPELGLRAGDAVNRFASPQVMHNPFKRSEFALRQSVDSIFMKNTPTEASLTAMVEAGIYGRILYPHENVPAPVTPGPRLHNGYQRFFCSSLVMYGLQSGVVQQLFNQSGIASDRSQFRFPGTDRINPQKVTEFARFFLNQPGVRSALQSSGFAGNYGLTSPIDLLDLVYRSRQFDHCLTLYGRVHKS